MAAGAEAHQLRRIGRLGLARVVLTLELRRVDQQFLRRRLAGQRGKWPWRDHSRTRRAPRLNLCMQVRGDGPGEYQDAIARCIAPRVACSGEDFVPVGNAMSEVHERKRSTAALRSVWIGVRRTALLAALAASLVGCGKAANQSPSPPEVMVAQVLSQKITDWDEYRDASRRSTAWRYGRARRATSSRSCFAKASR